MFRIFTTEPFLRRLFNEQTLPADQRSALLKIVLKQDTIFTAKPSADRTWANSVAMGYNVRLQTSLADYIDDLPEHPERLLEHPTGYFILDIPKERAEWMRTTFGVYCQSTEKADALPFVDQNVEFSPAVSQRVEDGWGRLLGNIKQQPSNAMVIIDRYLFCRDKPRFANGVRNVASILRVLLPRKLGDEKSKVDYHVTIVYQADQLGCPLEVLAKRLQDEMGTVKRPYNVQMELLGITNYSSIYNDCHNRRILTNYNIVKMEHMVGALFQNWDPAQRTYFYNSACTQTITPQRLFTEHCLSHRSDAPAQPHTQTLRVLHDFSKSLAAMKTSANIYTYALNGCVCQPPGGQLQNRLFL